MKCHIFVAVTILSLLQHEASSNPVLLELKAAYDTANHLMTTITTAKSMADLISEVSGPSISTNELRDILLKRIDNLQNSLQVNIAEDIQQASRIDRDTEQIFNEMSEINRLFNSYYSRLNDISDYSRQEFITKATSIHADSPDKRITTIANIIVPAELWALKSNFFDRLVAQLNTKPHHRCGQLQSPQQYVLALYNLIGTIEFRGFTMMMTAYKMRSFNSSNNAEEQKKIDNQNKLDIKRIKEEHERRMEKYLPSVKKALTDATTVVARCHPTYIPDNVYSSDPNVFDGVYYVSLMEQRSSYVYNMVVTGVRFKMVRLTGGISELATIHIQIQEGKLTAGGEIEPGSTRWVPIEMRKNSGYLSKEMSVKGQMSGEYFKMVENRDYANLLVRYGHLHTGDVKVCTDCVIIGVQIAAHDGYAFFLKLTYAHVDMEKGVVLPSRVGYTQSYNADPYANSYEYPQFLDIRNRRSSNVKYFDSNEIYTEPRSPLSGMGFYLAPDSEHGDALALRVHNADLSSKIKTEL